MKVEANSPVDASRARQVLLASRPALWINTVGVGVVGVWLSGQLYTLDPRVLALLVWLTLPFNLLIYGLNDVTDRAEDALSERKGGWQGARLRDRDVGTVLWSVAALNAPFLVYFACSFPPSAFATLLLSVLLFAFYSLPPVRFKARPFLDSLSNVAYALPVVVPALVLGRGVPWLPLAALMAWSIGKHAFDAAQDVSADRGAGLATIATTLGVRRTALWSLAWFGLAGALLLPLSVLSASSVWLVSGGLAVRLLLDATEGRARHLYRASLLSPWIVGTISGVQLVYVLARALT
ncbi:4-hydroxybenzoate polyprenyltransferase [Deinococcus yavapaiensis KR-236]|uniref:4-hydroxybenzoate polyprenyltransferase n=2 Tax=Deinococcus TaxID=1298 RepID=A0A318S927_9DEIO|nr:UbiA family prenyltransferase [Deinococcus yavapaiensis]PYE54487.1 4-hydroxybenzoate polyprenyltransferase [Deinococcus yavapaiensis KR-236]